jgi:hypothetical protein
MESKLKRAANLRSFACGSPLAAVALFAASWPALAAVQ